MSSNKLLKSYKEKRDTMKIQPYITVTRVRLFVAIVLALSFSIPVLAKIVPNHFAPAHAAPSYLAFQLDPDVKVIIRQNGIRVGEIFTPFREPGATNYVEHWVLYDNFVNIGKDPSVVTTLEVSKETYKSEEDFFAQVPWGQGFRYVRVDCTDTDRLPGR